MINNNIENHQPLAVCLHGSASSSRQWSKLAELLEPRIRTIMPDLVGYGDAEHFQNGTRFHLDQEVENVLRQIRFQTGKDNGPLHLIAHSYGGAVALHMALKYPQRVASLTVYEPAQFLMLFEDELEMDEAAEVLEVGRFVRANTASVARCRIAAKCFIDYWSGEGAWDRIPAERQDRFAGMMPKVAAEFEAILRAGVSASDFARLDIPVRLICGSETRGTARKVTDVLTGALPNVECIFVEGAAHMAPVTQADRVNPLFAGHVLSNLESEYKVAA
jgi:pimeloyl-ACP methyl ester carboxylesterase